MKVDVRLGAPLGAVRRRTGELAALGVDGLYTFEGPRDVFFPLVLAADASTDLDLWTNVAIAPPRSPMHLAYQAFDLQRASGGRFALGLGVQVRAHVERRYGAVWDRPVGQMRETIQALRAIFACWQDGEELDFVGEHTRHTLMPPVFDPGPLEDPGPPPILAGAVGPQMTRMVAEEADGLVVHPLNSPAFLTGHTLPLVAEGRAAAGRPADDLRLVCGALVGLHRDARDRDRAVEAVRSLVAFYASTPAYRVVLEHHGLGGIQPELRELTRAGRWTEMAALVDDSALAELSVVGTPDAVAAGLRDRYAGIADRVALSIPHEVDDGLLAELVAELRADGPVEPDRNMF